MSQFQNRKNHLRSTSLSICSRNMNKFYIFKWFSEFFISFPYFFKRIISTYLFFDKDFFQSFFIAFYLHNFLDN